MATVTKLKAAVNNKNLPILGEDGNLYNYYYGRFENKLAEYGVSPTETEKNALNVLITDGIQNGWIEKVIYLLPFIGNSTNPISGLVPLIDNVADYELSVDSIDEDAFTYNQNGTIKTFGNPSYLMPEIQLPLSNDNMGGGISVFVNKTGYSDEPTDTTARSVVNCSKDSKSYYRISLMYSSSNLYRFFARALRKDDTFSSPTKIYKSEFNGGDTIGIFNAYYKDSEVFRFKRYVQLKDISTPSSDMAGSETDAFDYVSNVGVTLSGGSYIALKNRINMVAMFNPFTVVSADMGNFNQAVFTLMTALGR